MNIFALHYFFFTCAILTVYFSMHHMLLKYYLIHMVSILTYDLVQLFKVSDIANV